MPVPRGYRRRSGSQPTPSDDEPPAVSDPDSPVDTGTVSDASSSTGTGSRRRRPAPSKPLRQLRSDLVDFYAGIGLLLKPAMPLPAEVVVKQAEPCADAWVRAAEANGAIRRVLESFSTVSVFGTLIMAHIPIVVAVQVQLGRIPIEHPLARCNMR